MTLADVRLRLGVSRKVVVHLIPALKGYKVGRQWRFDSADVEAFVASQKSQQAEVQPIGNFAVPRSRVSVSVSGWPGSERYR